MSETPLTPERMALLQELFEQALELPPEARASFVKERSAGEGWLHDELLGLLDAHERADASFESHLVRGVAPDPIEGSDDWEGVRLGVWQITRRIGFGGMGTVCEAVRADDQYQQRVAIKLLHRHAGSEGAVKRFRAERQILASLSHPNIATLIDGGVTEEGQPYLVMEYVDGSPITHWCDGRKLATRDRVKLFLQVCAAVETAHRNLVVHRDLKPGNILVTESGHVKLLDFGIARLMKSTDEEGALPATVAAFRTFTADYAAPEQILNTAVGTSADIYALGAVLFELLSGRRPFDLQRASLIEIERTVCQTPAPRAQVDEDLDAVIAMALRKEPERRYSSVDMLANDLRNYLDGLPVRARPDGVGYRLKKLIGRRKLESAAVAIALLSLIGGLIAATLQAQRAERQSLRATSVTEFLTTMLGAADPASLGKDVTVREVLDVAAERADALAGTPGLEAELRTIIGRTYMGLGEFEAAEQQYLRAIDAHYRATPRGSNELAVTMSLLSHAQEFLGRYEDANRTLQEAAAMLERFPHRHAEDQADFLDQQGRILTRLGHHEAAEAMLTNALALVVKHEMSDESLATAHANLGYVKSDLGKKEEAVHHYSTAVEAARRAFGSEHPRLAEHLSPYASVLERAGRMDEADAVYLEVIAMRRKLLGAKHPDYAWTVFNYADSLVRRGRYEDGARYAREVLALRGKTLPDTHLAVSTAMAVLGRALGPMGELEEAERWLRESLELRKQTIPEGHWLIASSESVLGGHFVLAGRYDEAQQWLIASERKLVDALGEDSPVVHDARERMKELQRRRDAEER